jgi:hypothetical protein
MKHLLILVVLFSGFNLSGQLLFSETDSDIGVVEEAYQVTSVVTVTNTAPKTVFLMRADTDKETKVQAINKKLAPGDTTSLYLTYTPKKSGKFKSVVELVVSDRGQPYRITWSGELKKWKQDDKMACYYFKRPSKNTSVKEEPVVIAKEDKPKDVSNKIPDVPDAPFSKPQEPSKPLPVEKSAIEDEYETNKDLPLTVYKPNNIVFLVDVSSSMKDSLKLPLMKLALYRLIDALRDVDRVSFITYADSVKVINENISGSDKEQLKKSIQLIKAKGLTKGNKAILASIDVIIKHYVAEGNNQIILATDGEFRMAEADYIKWKNKTMQYPIIVSTVGFGNEKNALKNLKAISDKGKGSFIHIKSRKNSEALLLEEVRLRSKR